MAERLCPVPIAPIFSPLGATRDVLVTGLTLLRAGDGVGNDPVGTTEGFHVEPPLTDEKVRLKINAIYHRVGKASIMPIKAGQFVRGGIF